MNKKVCFVVMGFGKKKDPDTNRTIDLDATYKKIIRPAVEEAGCKCIRADEIVESGIIDRSMYALLYYADVVIADISTFNPNAIYELGVRHTLRPYSTIIIKEDEGKIPFDINHGRTLSYKHLGNEISDQEIKNCVPQLRDLIKSVVAEPHTDSPLYSYIPNTRQPEISHDEIMNIIGELKDKEDTIYSLTEKAKERMEANDFNKAEEYWSKLGTKVENDKYYIQQQSLCRYKSETPSKLRALTDALSIINKIDDDSDTETLGIRGAICKRIWLATEDPSYLDTAIESYKKGWNLYKDYYNGENYANCMLMKARISEGEFKVHSRVEAEITYKEVISVIQKSLDEGNPEELKWKYATLSNSYLALNNDVESVRYEKLFKEQSPSQWEIDTFEKTRKSIR